MGQKMSRLLWLLVATTLFLGGCGSSTARTGQNEQGEGAPASAERRPRVLAVETFLADITQNVAGERLQVTALLPAGVDPHSFESAPDDVIRVAQSDVLVVNGAGFEGFLDALLQNAGGERMVIEASAGLNSRARQAEEVSAEGGRGVEEADHAAEDDPHFWLDVTNTIKYVENIRDGLIEADPSGAETYESRAEAYIEELQDLDEWIVQQVQQIPEDRRLLVTNHESFGYFADRYGFKLVGTVIPSASSNASPSAQQLAQLVDRIRASGARAIFLETGSSPQLAQQVAAETGIKVVTELYTHSTTDTTGPAPTYIDMMKHNTRTIVEALE